MEENKRKLLDSHIELLNNIGFQWVAQQMVHTWLQQATTHMPFDGNDPGLECWVKDKRRQVLRHTLG